MYIYYIKDERQEVELKAFAGIKIAVVIHHGDILIKYCKKFHAFNVTRKLPFDEICNDE